LVEIEVGIVNRDRLLDEPAVGRGREDCRGEDDREGAENTERFRVVTHRSLLERGWSTRRSLRPRRALDAAKR
jgi:hypothetical protein